MRQSHWLIFTLLACLWAGPGLGATYVWWEGENTTTDNFAKKTGFDARTFEAKRHEVLSGGDWLTNGGKRATGEAEAFAKYTVEVPADGTYSFWTRKFWKHGPFRWRFDQAEWKTCGRDISLADSTYIRLHLGANWVYLGEVKLTQGTHDFELRLLAAEGQSKTACFDAFVLTQGPFMPRGKLKPDEKSGKAEPGFFAWEPAPDPLLDDCPIDLRYLNEKQAGASGFVQRKGFDMVLGNGQPVRFWMIQGAALQSMSHKEIDWWARRLAKYGVNLVRLHAQPWDPKGKKATDTNKRNIDKIQYIVAALKKQGIYTYLGHVFWANWKIDSAKGFPPGYKDKACHGLLEFSDAMRQIYYTWVKDLMCTQSPYTGVALGQEPAVAVFEIQNEDSVLFWSSNTHRMPAQTQELIERQFGRWLLRKYGSFDKAKAAWGPDKYPYTIGGYKKAGPDDWNGGRIKLYGIGHLTSQNWAVSQRNEKRASDQFQFLVETQKNSYDAIIKHLRETLGVKNAIACSNWKTADARIMDTMERYTYSGGDVMCRNDYFGVQYRPKPERFYAVDVGDTYKETSGLLVPERVPLQLHQLAEYPHMITENNWDRPNRFRAEFPFLIATYGSLIGVDGWNFFAMNSSQWSSSMSVWSTNDTTVLGQFPAAALIFRRGDVKEAEAVVHEALTFDEQYAFKGTAIRETQGLDELWQKMVGADKVRTGQSPSAMDPLAFYVGRVERSLGKDKARALVKDLRPYIDRQQKVVKSVTGELRWDYGKGVVTVNTPRAQGVCGFLSQAGRIDLPDVVIESPAEYISILVVSLDGKPLAAAKKILIQAGTEDHTFGFKTKAVQDKKLGAMKQITALGGYPLNVRKVQATVTLKKAAGKQAIVLDGNGYLTERKAQTTTAGRLKVQLPEDSLYTLVR